MGEMETPMRKATPRGEKFSSNAPLRLAVAATVAFPDGSMSASGLRRESARGRLLIERIAGRDYTTLENIEQMRKLCRVQAKDHVSTCAEPDPALDEKQFGLSATAKGISPRDALARRLTKDHRKLPSAP